MLAERSWTDLDLGGHGAYQSKMLACCRSNVLSTIVVNAREQYSVAAISTRAFNLS